MNILWIPKLVAKAVINTTWFPLGLRERLPVNRLGDSAYPRNTLTGHLAHYRDFLRWRSKSGAELFRINIMEVGPGYTPAAAFINYWLGGGRTCLMDIGDFLNWTMGEITELADLVRMLCREVWLKPPVLYRGEDRLLKTAGEVSSFWPRLINRESLVAGMEERIGETLEYGSVAAGLEGIGTKILIRGLSSYPEIADDSLDFCFSTGVLQFIKKGEVEPTIREIFRVLRPGGITSHFISLNDHLVDSLNHLTVPDRLWESMLIYRAHTYLNRNLAGDWQKIFIRTGFEELLVTTFCWEKLPVIRLLLRSEFRRRSEDELLIKEMGVVYRKPERKYSVN